MLLIGIVFDVLETVNATRYDAHERREFRLDVFQGPRGEMGSDRTWTDFECFVCVFIFYIIGMMVGVRHEDSVLGDCRWDGLLNLDFDIVAAATAVDFIFWCVLVYKLEVVL